ncbi:MAG: hypothetical protein ACE37B_18135 [Ilumatobacter sp.]|jgi:hypothetical protein|uniref:hypothetical protein n=1 Tax=Ilumatobacter sp. TaxID=1967498 RepID=UPI00391C79F6
MNASDPDRATPDDLNPEAITEERAWEEPPLNHLSPMGQVEAIGRFAQGAGGPRLRRWFQIAIPPVIAALLIAAFLR